MLGQSNNRSAKQDEEKQQMKGQDTLEKTPIIERPSEHSFVAHQHWQFVVNSSIRRGRVF